MLKLKKHKLMKYQLLILQLKKMDDDRSEIKEELYETR